MYMPNARTVPMTSTTTPTISKLALTRSAACLKSMACLQICFRRVLSSIVISILLWERQQTINDNILNADQHRHYGQVARIAAASTACQATYCMVGYRCTFVFCRWRSSREVGNSRTMSRETTGPKPLSRRQALVLLAGVPPLAFGLAADSPRVSAGDRSAM